MKNLTFFYLLLMGLSSCSSYQDISKGKELNEATIRTMLRPGESYQIKLNYGRVMTINVTHVDSIYLYGKEKVKTKNGDWTKQEYKDSYRDLNKYVTRISEKKFNPWMTIGVIVIPVAIIYGIALESVNYSPY